MSLANASATAARPIDLPGVSADVQARRNLAANLEAMAATQPSLATAHDQASLPPVGEWVYARDGTLTICPQPGQWWSGCSVPRRAAAAALRALAATGTTACFPLPPHPAYLAEVLARVAPTQAVVTILPESADFLPFLSCEDFSTDISAHRLWFAVGEGWPAELENVFAEQPGLPIPQSFIRAPAAAEQFEPIVVPAQQAFSRVSSQRGRDLAELPKASTEASQICLVAGSHFRLWDDAGIVLAAAAGDAIGTSTVHHINPDNPAQAGPLPLARVATTSRALLAVDFGRADQPGIAPIDLPWLTWATRDRVPAFAGASPRDRLLIADAALLETAQSAGWPIDRVTIALWPIPELPPADALHAGVTFIADASDLQSPKILESYSSHRLLWESIAHDLSLDPFVVGDDPAAYLADRAEHTGIKVADLDQRLFIESLIVPAYQRAILQTLADAGIPLRIAGSGWNTIDGLSQFATPTTNKNPSGSVNSRTRLLALIASAGALLDAFPGRLFHPVRRTGRPIVTARGCRRDGLLRQAWAALHPSLRPAGPATPDNHQPCTSDGGSSAPALTGRLLSDILASI